MGDRRRPTKPKPIEPGTLPPLLDVDEVAELLRMTTAAVRSAEARRQLPGAVRIGRRLRFRRDTLLHWIAGLEEPGPDR